MEKLEKRYTDEVCDATAAAICTNAGNQIISSPTYKDNSIIVT